MYDFEFDDIDSETPNFDFNDYEVEDNCRKREAELLREAQDFDTDFYGDDITICEDDDYADLLNNLDVEIDETFEGDL